MRHDNGGSNGGWRVVVMVVVVILVVDRSSLKARNWGRRGMIGTASHTCTTTIRQCINCISTRMLKPQYCC